MTTQVTVQFSGWFQRFWLSSCIAALCLLSLAGISGDEIPIPEQWDYVASMKKIAAKFKGRPGVVLHIGDSITYANPYGQWARYGKGKTADDIAILKWMHCGARDETDGWWLAAFDHPAGGRSYTACSAIRADEMLRGGKRGLPSLAELLDKYGPQVVVLMLGTNDATARRPVEAYRRDMERAVETILSRGVICILSTIPPHPQRLKLTRTYNKVLREIAKSKRLPLIDYEREILKRRPNDWNGTLLVRNDPHPTARRGSIKASSAPTAENLRNSGYLLRGWLSVKKIAEVKRTVLDGLPLKPGTAADALGAGENRGPAGHAIPAPKGETLRVLVTRDTWFSNVGREADCNLGGQHGSRSSQSRKCRCST